MNISRQANIVKWDLLLNESSCHLSECWEVFTNNNLEKKDKTFFLIFCFHKFE